MDTRKLGNLTVSAIGMGCMGFSHGYGAIPTEEYSIEAIQAALDYGCTFLDTSEAYGPYLADTGHNEKIVGKAIQGRRKDVVLATKLFLGTDEARKNLYGALRHHLDASLDRLGTDYADLYYLHRINPEVPVEHVAEGMGRLIQDGLIRGWGLSMVNADILQRAHEVTPVSAVQNIYSMMERDYEKRVIPYCQAHNIGFVAFSPIASGYLSGKVTADTRFEGDDVRKWVPQLSRENLTANRPFLDLVSGMAERKGTTNAQISLAWMLKKYPHVVPIPGSKNKGRILENLGASQVHLTDAEFSELDTALSALTVHGRRKDMDRGTEYID